MKNCQKAYKNLLDDPYYRYSAYLKQKYHAKVYKIPLSMPCTCPNRLHFQTGCDFCAESGAGFEHRFSGKSISEQIKQSKSLIQKKYKAEKFIAYFQNYTNTFISFSLFQQCIKEALAEDVVEICISTRPDCIKKEYLDFLKEFKQDQQVEISFELGLQTVQYQTLYRIHRGHGLAEFIDAVYQIQHYSFPITAHLILNLPHDNEIDTIEAAKICSALQIDLVKLHALYLPYGSEMLKQYQNNEFELGSLSEYVNRVIIFLEYLSPTIAIQRLIGRIPQEDAFFSNWGTSWWKIRDLIEKKMKEENRKQGSKFNYLQGAAMKLL